MTRMPGLPLAPHSGMIWMPRTNLSFYFSLLFVWLNWQFLGLSHSKCHRAGTHQTSASPSNNQPASKKKKRRNPQYWITWNEYEIMYKLHYLPLQRWSCVHKRQIVNISVGVVGQDYPFFFVFMPCLQWAYKWREGDERQNDISYLIHLFAVVWFHVNAYAPHETLCREARRERGRKSNKVRAKERRAKIGGNRSIMGIV